MTSTARWLELLFWLALASAALGLTTEFADELGGYRWGAASWPRAVLALMIVIALVQFLRQRRIASSSAPAATNADANTSNSSLVGIGGRLAATLALPLVYLALLPYSGFYVTTPIFLFVLLLLLGERRWRYLIVTPLLIFTLVCVLFTTLFYVALPTGNWPGFYDISNWLIVLLRGGR